MTNKEKVIELKDTIYHLYCKEGRSKNYISRLLYVERKILTEQIKEWGFAQANISHLTPSNMKFASKNKDFIIARYKDMSSDADIAEMLGVGVDYLKNIAKKMPEINEAREEYLFKYKNKGIRKQFIEEKRVEHNFDSFNNEEWKRVLGYEEYEISNYGRTRKYMKTYGCYRLLKPYPNVLNGRLYIKLRDKNLQVSRLVGHAFVDGFSEENNTINHKDKDVSNNHADNLEWVTQSQNNQHAYDDSRCVVKAYSKNEKFKEIVLDDKWRFKTIHALAKFLNVSDTEVQRYISKDIQFDRKIEFVY